MLDKLFLLLKSQPSMNTPPLEILTFSPSLDDEGERLDRFLAKMIDGATRSRLKDLIKAGHVRRQDVVVQSPNARVRQGDCYEVHLPPLAAPAPKPQNIPLKVVYEDDDLIVVDKAAGMVVHPATGHWHGTLVNALLYHCGDSLSGVGGVARPGIVHRLDRFTSGLMVVAKNDAAHHGLSQQFADHGREGPLTRAYTAFVWGVPPRAQGTIETQIGRSPQNAVKMAVLKEGGKTAITHYEVAARYGVPHDAAGLQTQISGGVAKVVCRLETGRTHQIRVHMTHIGHPLLADPLYGTGFKTKASLLPLGLQQFLTRFNRQALHAFLLGFAHPITGQHLEFTSELPKKMKKLENSLKTL